MTIAWYLTISQVVYELSELRRVWQGLCILALLVHTDACVGVGVVHVDARSSGNVNMGIGAHGCHRNQDGASGRICGGVEMAVVGTGIDLDWNGKARGNQGQSSVFIRYMSNLTLYLHTATNIVFL